jgi:hypothetical protein
MGTQRMPTYEIVKDFDEEQALRSLIEGLRADNGKRLRRLLQRLGNDPASREFADLIVHHPNLKDLVGH